MNIVVDVEADGPIPGPYSMVSFGAVIVESGLERTFYGQCRPISDKYIPEALKISGHTRDETMNFDSPEIVMSRFNEWIKYNTKGRPLFWSDNNGFDWSFINYYFHVYVGDNPFGWASHNVKDLYKGLCHNLKARPGKLRNTKHTHHPVDDAMGYAEVLLKVNDMYGLNLRGVGDAKE